MGIYEGILFYDVQKLFAKYREEIYSESIKDLYDEVSNRFMKFPPHLIDLDKLIWQ
jgi:hypothetical protein